MKLAYITAGAAGMYCGSCMHDNTLASALIALGHDVALVPVYTPVRTDETDVSIPRVFYGAVNVYLEQKSALFRHTPWLVDRLLNTNAVLGWAAGRGASVDARELGDLTLSVLRGEDGNQRKELDRLVAWLRDDFRPEIVHLSNLMLVGMARRIRSELGVPVLCSVQGEDIFLDELVEPHRSRVRETLRERAQDADGFIATSRYYQAHMQGYLDVAADRMHLVHLGIKLDDFMEITPGAREEEPFVIGYLARVCPEKGLHILVEAFRRLVEQTGKDRVRLEIAGYLGPRDRAYFDSIMEQVATWGLGGIVKYHGEVDRRQKVQFFGSLDVLSVPTTYHEPKGLFVLEALASGVPVVQPGHGAFPELLEATGGGVLVEPDSIEALASGLRDLMERPEHRAELARAGRAAVRQHFSAEKMARATLSVYANYGLRS